MLNVAETCAPENPVQLLTDISVYPNMTADDVILAERIAGIKARTGVAEMIVDGNYSGERSEAACSQEGVNLIPTEVKGRKPASDEISLAEFHFNGNVIVTCPEGQAWQEQIHKPEKGGHIAHFAQETCARCHRRENCLVRGGKRFYSLRYNDRQVLLSRRRLQLGVESYHKRCLLRPAVEGTISQFKRLMHQGKLRIRGLGRVRNSIILMAIGINFGRLWAYCLESKTGSAVSLAMHILFLKCLILKTVKRRIFSPLISVSPFSDLFYENFVVIFLQ